MCDKALPARIISLPSKKYDEKYRFWQGCPTVVCTPKGRLYAGWYSGGTREPSPNHFNILLCSDDEGMSWSKPLLVIESLPENNIRVIDIQLWLDPLKRMWLFWTIRDDNFKQTVARHLKTFAIVCADPDMDKLEWTEPRLIGPGFLRCQPTALSNGRYIACTYTWAEDRYCYSESCDNGETWKAKYGGRKVETPFDETMVLERKDGILWMLARSTKGYIAESTSNDFGQTWSDGSLTSIEAPSSRVFIKRLLSGRVLLIYNAHPQERTNMTVALSEDDGKTWPYSLIIDKAEEISYPDAATLTDSSIFIIYDHGRTSFKEIVTARITEEDILAGKLVNNGSYLKNIISKAPAIPYDEMEYEEQRNLEKIFWEKFKIKNEL